MKNPFEVLDPEELAIFEWQFRMTGGFKTSLMETIGRADEGNKDRLAVGFPTEVAGYRKYAYVDGWWESVLKKMSEA